MLQKQKGAVDFDNLRRVLHPVPMMYDNDVLLMPTPDT
jgi:hypothetical protein